ncbi:MAG: HEAT repeat domain-containing protein, partial [Deltaproteobacteria bacterium]|nr:HEAT repeat domain-containing protein [Deltaproteobacteria bacterium]
RLSRTATDWAVRVRVARVLGAIGTEDVVEPLARLLTTDAFAFVRHAAAEALGQSGRARAAGALETAASRDSEPAVREAATAAIAHLRAAP